MAGVRLCELACCYSSSTTKGIRSRSTGWTLLRTLNYYSPPAYTSAGEELPAARRS
jgi:hypothetical protein